MRIPIYITLLIFVSACKGQPECNSDQVKSMVLEIYKKDLAKHLGDQSAAINKKNKNAFPFQTDSIVNSFFRNSVLQINNVMTTEKNEDLYSCSCKGDLSYSISDNFKTELSQNSERSGDKKFTTLISRQDLNFEKNVEYKVQITDDSEKIVVEALVTTELREAIEKFTLLYVFNELYLRHNKNE